MTVNIFEQAARTGLRFTTTVGVLSTEQVFQLPLENNRAALDLDRLAKAVNAELEASSTKSFVKKTTDRNKVAQLQMDIVLFIINDKLEAKAAAEKRALKAAERNRLMEQLSRTQEAKLGAMTEDEVKAALAKLDEEEA